MTPPIPENSITKPPSAELRPGQLDTDSLPDYEVLDELLALYVDSDAGFDDLLAAGFDAELVTRVSRMTDAAEWKRRQYPPGPKISLKAFGRDRRLPITNRWRERATGAGPRRLATVRRTGCVATPRPSGTLRRPSLPGEPALPEFPTARRRSTM